MIPKKTSFLSKIIDSTLFIILSNLIMFLIPGFLTALSFKHSDREFQFFWLKYWVIISPLIFLENIISKSLLSIKFYRLFRILFILLLLSNTVFFNFLFDDIIVLFFDNIYPFLEIFLNNSLTFFKKFQNPLQISKSITKIYEKLEENEEISKNL